LETLSLLYISMERSTLPRYDREASARRPRYDREASARSPRYDREAVGEESPVRPRGRRRGVPDTTARPSARSPRYDREASARSHRYDGEAVGDQSQTLSVSEGERPITPSQRGILMPPLPGNRPRFRTTTGSESGLSPSLTLRVWLWSPPASRSYRGLLADASRSYRGLFADGLALAPGKR